MEQELIQIIRKKVIIRLNLIRGDFDGFNKRLENNYLFYFGAICVRYDYRFCIVFKYLKYYSLSKKQALGALEAKSLIRIVIC